MFQTALPQYAGFHAAARCLSGGPVVITDTPGDHDVDLIQQMTATTPGGHSITLRPTSMATPSDPYMSYTSSKLLRITNVYLGSSSRVDAEVASFVGFFNISTIPARDLFRLSDFDGLLEGFYYVTRSYRSGHITPPVSRANADDAFMTLRLEPGEWDILTAVPATRVFDSSNNIACYVGTFGLGTNMTGAAAVIDTSVDDIADGNGLGCGISIRYSLSALGTLCRHSYYSFLHFDKRRRYTNSTTKFKWSMFPTLSITACGLRFLGCLCTRTRVIGGFIQIIRILWRSLLTRLMRSCFRALGIPGK